MAVDKNQAVIDFMIQCPQIRDNPLFFNAIKAGDNNKEIITVANDKALERPFIDGSVSKRFTFTIIDFRSVTYQAVVKQAGYTNENVEEMLDVQSIIDWIEAKNLAGSYPDFGNKCHIDEMRSTSNIPNLNGIDSSVSPDLAKYSITIQIDYIDSSKRLWT